MKSLAFLVFLYLVVPGSGQLVWDGLPLSTRAEVVALGLFVVVFLSRELRRTLAEVLGRREWSGLIKPILVILCAAKFLSFAWAPLGGGFASCYRSIYYPLENRTACEKSYEAPFSQGMGAPFAKSSRMDRVVDFGEYTYDWSLPFVNDFPRLRNLWLERIPFKASFAARVEGDNAGRVLPVFGIGEVSVAINGSEMARVEDYSRDFVAATPLPTRAADLVVKYEYRDDELAVPPDVEPIPRGPYARLKIGTPMTVGELAEVSRVRVTGDSVGANESWQAEVVVLDRDGNTVEFTDVNAQRASSRQEPDPLLRAFDMEIEVPASALLRGPLTLKSVRNGESIVLGTISTQVGTLSPRLDQTKTAAEFASFSASLTADREELAPLAPGVRETPTLPLRALLAALDFFSFALLLSLGYVLLRTMQSDVLHAAALAVLGWLVIKPLDSILPSIVGGGRELVIPYAIIAAVAVLAYRRQIDRYPLPFLLPLAIVLSALKIFEHLHFNHPDQRPHWWGKLFFYWRDSDWFVARGNGRAIFTTGSLQANDPVFFSQAASRYLAFASNSLLGEQDVLIGMISLAIGFIVVLVLAARVGNGHARTSGRVLAVCIGFVSLIFLGDQLIVAFAFFVSSEYPTWIALLGITAYLINPSPEERRWTIGVIAAGLGALTNFRPNSLFVFLYLLPILIWRKVDWQNKKLGVPQAFWAVSVFTIILPLSLIHNLYYGASFLPFVGNASLIYAFNWTDIVSIEGFRGALWVIWDQLRAVMYWREPNDPNFAIFFWGCQFMLAAAIILRVWLRQILTSLTLVTLLPLAYAIPMLKFQLDSYYPRFIVAASLLCLCSALIVWPQKCERA
jgi:hypothetical protein